MHLVSRSNSDLNKLTSCCIETGIQNFIKQLCSQTIQFLTIFLDSGCIPLCMKHTEKW